MAFTTPPSRQLRKCSAVDQVPNLGSYKYPKKTPEKLLEPDGARVCRRNILALAGVVVVAGFAGADPREISVFGVKPSGDWGYRVRIQLGI